MADLLITHLKKKGEEHSSLESLVNQWGFDEKLIPKALQTVGNLFPHYSRHDESHSKQILINIERLLGKDGIDQLTATDTWLLLEAAYWHDIGMVVSHDDAVNAVNLPAFNDYIENIRNDPKHELNKFAINFDPTNMSKCFCGAESPIEAVDNFRLLMAEWFRNHHAQRSSLIVKEPFEISGINSPRTELIPARLIRLLAQICQMHGEPFEDILKGLPFREAGLAQEDCHPRFVACLLRLGDLLDIDDNRFCPVMQKITGQKRPQLTKSHEEKHKSIRHLRIDRERIEISAECQTIDGYLETFKWFDWLKQEIQNQMTNWSEIVPNRSLGLIPTVGEISVKLNGDSLILKNGERPQFRLEEDKVIELLKGSNLYNSKYACIRELLQNSIDATLLRLWLTEGIKSNDKWDSPESLGIKKALGDSSVNVKLHKLFKIKETNKTVWELTINDNGTGISKTDLAYMLHIAGSNKNENRQRKIRSMPEWMKPSGVFGIGFQSVFMMTDTVEIITKSIFTNEILKITMHSPGGKNEGLVIIKQLDNDISKNYGTEIKINLELNYYIGSFLIDLGVENKITKKLMNMVDPLLLPEYSYDAGPIADSIREIASHSPIQINGIMELSKSDSFPITEKVNNQNPNEDLFKFRFLRIENYELELRYTPIISEGYFNTKLKTLYRGQSFKSDSLKYIFPCVNITVNIMCGKASDWLTVNRDSLAPQAESILNELILKALERSVELDLNNPEFINCLSEMKPKFSFFLESMALFFGANWIFLAKQLDKEWHILPIDNQLKYKDLFCRNDFKICVKDDKNSYKQNSEVISVSNKHFLNVILYEWTKNKDSFVEIITQFDIQTNQKSNNKDFNISIEAENIEYLYKCTKVKGSHYSESALAKRLYDATINSGINYRYLLLANDEAFSSLFLLPEKIKEFKFGYLFYINDSAMKFILLPFLFNANSKNAKIICTQEPFDKFCIAIQPLLEKEISLEEIKDLYKKLIHYLDIDIMEKSPFWEKWKNLRGKEIEK